VVAGARAGGTDERAAEREHRDERHLPRLGRETDTDLAGYEVAWRETTDPNWTHVIPVGNVTTVTLPHFSRDNMFFWVRAVDESAHHSPLSFLAPF
jgi:hypothetical protein